MSVLLAADRLHKRYAKVHALDGLTLEVPQGGVFGVLGPNGAGKSTLFRIWLGLVRATAGEARVLGAPPASDIARRRRIGSMIETPRFFPFLTARETLQVLARAAGVAGAAASPDTLLDRVGLSGAADRKVRGFSVGMAQRLGIAAALLGRPEVVILDEPTSGMDPAGIQEIRSLIRSLADRDGVTVVLASHQLGEVQRVCDRVAILDGGRVVTEGAVSALIAGQAERLRLLASPAETVLEVLGDRGACEGGAVLAAITRSEAPGLIREIAGRGVDLIEARWVGGDLERVFLERTGEPRV